MKVIPLLENRKEQSNLMCKHGLSLYIETANARMLLDTGPDGSFIKNAKTLGVDIASVDYLIISHGHSDHGGGLKAFLACNTRAEIIMSQYAFERHYVNVLGLIKVSVGLDPRLSHNPRIRFIHGVQDITGELSVFDSVQGETLLPKGNNQLIVKNHHGYQPDTFKHEIYLRIVDANTTYLFSSCSHRGILNILQRYRGLYKEDPNYVFAGLHLYDPIRRKGEASEFIETLAKKLAQNQVETYYTFHCTGEKAYVQMKTLLADRVKELKTGTIVDLPL